MEWQLEPSTAGLPIQIYAFTNTSSWEEYEGIQSDIFDPLFAILPDFDLRAHDAPASHSNRRLELREDDIH
ncbi:hypothetical protein [Candidatus Nitrotoga sp. M5]|uniref:hypothetical protein n=1 Tax=Candidatus Nitrotoga sp. M5 TaxID=2890409 RepID=UPI00403DA294